MKRKKLFLLFASTCLILALAVSPFMAACAKPAEPGVVDVAALQKQVVSLEKEVAAGEKEIASLEKQLAAAPKAAEVTKLEKEKTALEKGKAASEKEIAALEKEIASLEAKLAAAVPIAEVPGEFEWRFQSIYGPGAHTSNKQIIDRAAELTNGGLTIKEFFDGEIVPYDEVVQATGRGTIEISNGGIYSSGIDPALYSTQQVFSQRDPATDAWTLLNGSPFSELVREMYANHNCFYVGATEYGGLPYICSNVPIRTLDDWKGVKIRTAGPSVKVFEALGAATTWMPGSEVYSALLMGTVDVASWTCECVEEMHWNEVMDYLILPPFVEHGFDTILVNQDAWNSLPEEYQEALFRAVREAGMSEMKYWHDRHQRNLDMADEWGFEVITMSDEDIATLQAMGPDLLWPDFAAQSPMCARMIEAIKEWYHVE